jgi:hypothetical protein
VTDPPPLGKARRLDLLAGRGVPVPRHAVAQCPGDVRGLLSQLGYPAVLKPAGLGGGRGVYLVTAPQQIAGWAAMLAQFRYDGPVVAEEYVPGREVSAEVTSAGGRHRVTALIDRELSLPPLFVEMGHLYSGQPPGAAAQVAADALTACGRTDGTSYVAMRLTAGGPRVTGLGRREPGDPVSRLAALTAPGEAAALAHFWLPAGEVETVSGLAGIRALGYVRELAFPFAPGDRLLPTLDTHSRHGHVTLTAPSAELAVARIGEVKRLLTVTVKPRPATVPRPRTARRAPAAAQTARR